MASKPVSHGPLVPLVLAARRHHRSEARAVVGRQHPEQGVEHGRRVGERVLGPGAADPAERELARNHHGVDQVRACSGRLDRAPGAVAERDHQRVAAGLLDHGREIRGIGLDVVGADAARPSGAAQVVAQHPVVARQLLRDPRADGRRMQRHQRDRHERAVLALHPPFELGAVGSAQPWHRLDGTRCPNRARSCGPHSSPTCTWARSAARTWGGSRRRSSASRRRSSRPTGSCSSATSWSCASARSRTCSR